MITFTLSANLFFFDSRNLTQEFIIWKSIFLWSFHILSHWISMSYERNVVKGKKKKFAHRMLMMSFPWPIWAARAWSPLRRASFLVSNISTDVSWKITIISRRRCTVSEGIKSTRALRMRAVPIFAKAKDMTLLENKSFKLTDLKKIKLCANSLNSEYSQYFFNSMSVSMWHRIFSKGIEWIAQSTSSDKFKGAASYPFGNVNLRVILKKWNSSFEI